MNRQLVLEDKTFLITGAAGFIGYFLAKRLLDLNYKVIGIDNLNKYYDVSLKRTRLKNLKEYENFHFILGDISESKWLKSIFQEFKPNFVINLAAQAGVRYSIEEPDEYIKSNMVGFYNILESCKNYPVEHLLYASSSSVYGANKIIPFKEIDSVDKPVSLYAATKKSNELFAYTYSHLYNIPISGLRFFTVYGPMGRPDMAYFKFLDNYFSNKEILVFNNGDLVNDLYRDFTYIDDIVTGILKLIKIPPYKDENNTAHRVYNIGNNKPEKLMVFLRTLEDSLSNTLNKKVEFKIKYEPLKPGDVTSTYASTDLLEQTIEFKPNTSIHSGLQQFTDWYCDYYKITNN